jgi:hypothetical protein
MIAALITASLGALTIFPVAFWIGYACRNAAIHREIEAERAALCEWHAKLEHWNGTLIPMAQKIIEVTR